MILSCVQNPYLRDLIWLTECHFIEADLDLSQYWHLDLDERLLYLCRHPESLNQKMQQCKSHFLGSYFEALFSFAIEHLSTLTLIVEHLQIQAKGKTLGEVDMLVKTPEGVFYQFEIAVKFYLERPDNYPHHWLGPNKNDSLLKKVSRAREHQLMILKTSPGYEQIQPFTQGGVIQTALLIFGRLYYACKVDADITNSSLSSDRESWWLRISNVDILFSSFSHSMELKKPHWLALPNLARDFVELTPEYKSDLVTQFLQDSRPKHLCLWNKASSTSNRVFRHAFVVPDAW